MSYLFEKYYILFESENIQAMMTNLRDYVYDVNSFRENYDNILVMIQNNPDAKVIVDYIAQHTGIPEYVLHKAHIPQFTSDILFEYLKKDKVTDFDWVVLESLYARRRVGQDIQKMWDFKNYGPRENEVKKEHIINYYIMHGYPHIGRMHNQLAMVMGIYLRYHDYITGDGKTLTEKGKKAFQPRIDGFIREIDMLVEYLAQDLNTVAVERYQDYMYNIMTVYDRTNSLFDIRRLIEAHNEEMLEIEGMYPIEH